MSAYNTSITLTPLGRFFFGGENFAARGEKAFYLQHSADFPQQTTLLGLIRFQLLQQNQALTWDTNQQRISHAKSAALLIGSESFHPSPSDGIRTFGNLEGISPIFLVDGKGQRYLPYPRIRQWGEQDVEFVEAQLKIGIAGSRLLAPEKAQSLLAAVIPYDPKLGIEWGFKAIDDEDWLPYSSVYESMDAQVGINKSHTLPHRREEEQAEQEGFFKMTYQRLKPGFGFGALLRLTDPQQLTGEQMVFFGKERSPFSMEVHHLNTPEKWPAPPHLLAGQKIWLAAPARVDAKYLPEACEAVLGRQTSFRCMVTEVQEDYNYFGNPRISGRTKQPKISKRYNLLDRGTLLWIREKASENALQNLRDSFNDPAFYSIGYNHLLTL